MAGQMPEKLEELMLLLKNLPGIGRRGAERMALSLLEWEPEKLAELGAAVGNLPQSVASCPVCGALLDAGRECIWCSDVRRDGELVCLVENPAQIFSIEKSNIYRGRYFVLGGRISPLENRTAADLRIDALVNYVETNQVKELIIALGSDVEGRATAMFVAEQLSRFDLKITRLAAGLPAGANLDYADGATIAAALGGRTQLK